MMPHLAGQAWIFSDTFFLVGFLLAAILPSLATRFLMILDLQSVYGLFIRTHKRSSNGIHGLPTRPWNDLRVVSSGQEERTYVDPHFVEI